MVDEESMSGMRIFIDHLCSDGFRIYSFYLRRDDAAIKYSEVAQYTSIDGGSKMML